MKLDKYLSWRNIMLFFGAALIAVMLINELANPKYSISRTQSPELLAKLEKVHAKQKADAAAKRKNLVQSETTRGRLSIQHSSYFDEDDRVAIRARTTDGSSIHSHAGMELGAEVLAHAQHACGRTGRRVLMGGHGVSKNGIKNNAGVQTGWMYFIPCAR